MKMRSIAALFAVIFSAGAAPLSLLHFSGAVGAGLAAGFMSPLGYCVHVAALIALGLASARFGREGILMLPLCMLLMLAIGGMERIDEQVFPAIRLFLVCAIVLFSFSVSMLRNRNLLVAVPPVGIWLYFMGTNYMGAVPVASAPIPFLLGAIVSVSLLIAIGVCLSLTVSELIDESMEKLRTLPAVTSFLGFFL